MTGTRTQIVNAEIRSRLSASHTVRSLPMPHCLVNVAIPAGFVPTRRPESARHFALTNRPPVSLGAFRDPLRLRRCLIPADGFYEWARKGASKQPYCFEIREGELFAFAGIWDGWRNAEGQWVKTCSILTTTPNRLTSAIHDRMPAILHPDSYNL